MAGLGVARLCRRPCGRRDDAGRSAFHALARIRLAVVVERSGSPGSDVLDVAGSALLVRARNVSVNGFPLPTASANPFWPAVYDSRPHDHGFVPVFTGQSAV